MRLMCVYVFGCVCMWLGVCAVARPCQESVDVLSTVMASVYVVVDVQVSGEVDLNGLRMDELRGSWASALRLPSSNVLILSVSETGRAVRVAVRVDKGQTTDKVFAHIQQTAQSSAALRPLQVSTSTRTRTSSDNAVPPSVRSVRSSSLTLTHSPAYTRRSALKV